MYASPVSAAPDGGEHLTSIYCASSSGGALCLHRKRYDYVPATLVDSWSCFNLHRTNAGCQKLADRGVWDQLPVAAADLSKTSPGGYYWVMGMFATPNVSRSVYAMNALDVVLATLLLVGGLTLAPSTVRQAGGIGFVMAAGPVGWFLITTTTPSAWALIGVGLYWVYVLAAAYSDSTWKTILAFGGALVLAAMAFGSRADATAYIVALNVALVPLLWRRFSRAVWKAPAGILVALTTAAAVAAYAKTPQGSWAVNGGLQGGAHGIGVFVYNLLDSPQLLAGALGTVPYVTWQLAPPLVVPLVAIGLIAFLLTLSFGAHIPRIVLLSWAIVAATAIIVPLVVLHSGGAFVGQTNPGSALVQPRYILPLLPAVIGLPFLRPDTPAAALTLGRVQRWVWSIGCIFVVTVSLYGLISNYARASGSRTIPMSAPGTSSNLSASSFWHSDTYGNLDLSVGAHWRAVETLSPMALWVIGTLAAAAALVMAMKYLTPRTVDGRPPEVQASPDGESSARPHVRAVIASELASDRPGVAGG